MNTETIWIAIGSAASLAGLVLSLLKIWLSGIAKQIELTRTEASSNARRLHERIDDLSEKMDARYVRRETFEAVIQRIDFALEELKQK